uniref:Transcription factor MYBS1 n=1 Tax=Anthurium amnicola TaxID=1678845 RepID=A0A1D1XLI1_9ARAE
MTAGAAGAAVASTATGWSREEDKAFEDALAALLPLKEGEVDGEDERRWEELAAKVPGKTAAEVRRHYDVLMEDLRAIEAGKVPLPSYVGLEKGEEEGKREQYQEQQQNQGVAGVKRLGSLSGFSGFDSGRGHARSGSKAEQERRKGIPWTEEEHKLFLLGLDKFGKGDWRSISRNFVVSRSPTQVASHAQKYFIRLNSMNRDRRRASIHDITSVRNGDVSSPQAPITGQMSPAVGPPVPHPAHPHPAMPAMAMYGPAVGQPATGHIVSAVGTPIMRPGHPPYVIPVAYPVPPPPMHHP